MSPQNPHGVAQASEYHQVPDLVQAHAEGLLCLLTGAPLNCSSSECPVLRMDGLLQIDFMNLK